MSDARPAEIADTDVYITRMFAAPRELVFRFFTEPEHLASWFGPTGFSVPVETVEIDPRVGGRWNLSMVDDTTGESYPIRGEIVEFDPPERIVVAMNAQSDLGPLDKITLRLQFHDHGERTRLTLHQGPFSAIERQHTEGGWELSFAKLDSLFARDEV
ncbi:SRPBCC family protein [Subtercola endophyticus]|uniref:SRPBCC family protein n=1 Tax=Subtercola endophyticus TaxID=2895559 RepID=UPI001E58908A|nr:SRPBCC domain-containing protein [Subtercola endophyticus]UFS60513.1 SRPBCC domain-containing protein [Subtercola endophyticus]